MSVQKVDDSEKEEYFEQLERDLKKKNDEVRSREYCIVCNRSVREKDYGWKYMQAGGVLHGPFCSRECHFQEFMADDESENISK